MSYAIITVGGKQYRVQEGDVLLVDRVKTDEGKTFKPSVLLFGGDGKTQLSPKGVTVTARVVGHVMGEKIRIGKYKPKNGYKRHTGFRAGSRRIADRDDRRAAALEREGRARAEGGGRGGGPRRPACPKDYEGMNVTDRTTRPGPAPADARGRARLRAGARQAQGRDRGDRGRHRKRTEETLMAHKKASARRATVATRTRRCSA